MAEEPNSGVDTMLGDYFGPFPDDPFDPNSPLFGPRVERQGNEIQPNIDSVDFDACICGMDNSGDEDHHGGAGIMADHEGLPSSSSSSPPPFKYSPSQYPDDVCISPPDLFSPASLQSQFLIPPVGPALVTHQETAHNTAAATATGVQDLQLRNPPRRRARENTSNSPGAPEREVHKEAKLKKCDVCGQGHKKRRDLNRHYVVYHESTAIRMGLDVSKPICRYCGKLFRRKDHLTRHFNRKHGR